MNGSLLDLLALDASTGQVTWRCTGPDPAGACPRVAIGEVIPCVGHVLLRTDLPGDPYIAPPLMTLCPITLALALDAEMALLPRGLPAADPGWRSPPMPVAA